MNWDIVEGNWKRLKGRVKARWGMLTDDPLDVIAGKRIERAGRYQVQRGVSKREAARTIRRAEETR